MKRLLLLVVVFRLAAALAGFAAGGQEAGEGPVLIGMQGPITGAWAYEGQMAKQSCEIAAELITQKGGILGGRQIQIVVEDDAGEPKTGALAARGYVLETGRITVEGSVGELEADPRIREAYLGGSALKKR